MKKKNVFAHIAEAVWEVIRRIIGIKRKKRALVVAFCDWCSWPEDIFAHLEMLVPNKGGISTNDTEWVDFHDDEEENGVNALKNVMKSFRFDILVIEKKVLDFLEKSLDNPSQAMLANELFDAGRSFIVESKDDFGNLEKFLRIAA